MVGRCIVKAKGVSGCPRSGPPQFAELRLDAIRSSEIVNNNKAFSWAVRLRFDSHLRMARGWAMSSSGSYGEMVTTNRMSLRCEKPGAYRRRACGCRLEAGVTFRQSRCSLGWANRLPIQSKERLSGFLSRGAQPCARIPTNCSAWFHRGQVFSHVRELVKNWCHCFSQGRTAVRPYRMGLA